MSSCRFLLAFWRSLATKQLGYGAKWLSSDVKVRDQAWGIHGQSRPGDLVDSPRVDNNYTHLCSAMGIKMPSRATAKKALRVFMYPSYGEFGHSENNSSTFHATRIRFIKIIRFFARSFSLFCSCFAYSNYFIQATAPRATVLPILRMILRIYNQLSLSGN